MLRMEKQNKNDLLGFFRLTIYFIYTLILFFLCEVFVKPLSPSPF